MDRLLIGIAQAQEGGSPDSPGGSQFMSTLFVLGSFFLIFYFLIIRPQQKRQKQAQKMIAALKKGDRVLTSGGLFGTVWDVKEDRVIVKLAEELKVEVAKTSIQQVIEPK
ncbi:MAG: preprotein translocase subunit YajC [Candidatus Eisenbacteria bacterium]|nr:preprotein translocase subunit YajC [Candidatus Latescibacterota bacterium]MBD3300895.1 preprotein translocase subunit YajC [Candidatus Eisenbacteria bacterium]